jgi:hypothetical protein
MVIQVTSGEKSASRALRSVEWPDLSGTPKDDEARSKPRKDSGLIGYSVKIQIINILLRLKFLKARAKRLSVNSIWLWLILIPAIPILPSTVADYDSRVIFTPRCRHLASKVPHRSLHLITLVPLTGDE